MQGSQEVDGLKFLWGIVFWALMDKKSDCYVKYVLKNEKIYSIKTQLKCVNPMD